MSGRNAIIVLCALAGAVLMAAWWWVPGIALTLISLILLLARPNRRPKADDGTPTFVYREEDER